MAKRHFQLTREQRQELRVAYARSADGPLRTRLQAVRLYGSGYSSAAIQDITGCPRRTVWRWCERYQQAGLDGLVDQRQGNHRVRLSAEQVAEVKSKLEQYRPVDILNPATVATATGHYWTVPDLKRALAQWYGVVYKQAKSYHDLLKQCEFSYQRPARLYRSRSEAQVTEWAEQWEKN